LARQSSQLAGEQEAINSEIRGENQIGQLEQRNCDNNGGQSLCETRLLARAQQPQRPTARTKQTADIGFIAVKSGATLLMTHVQQPAQRISPP